MHPPPLRFRSNALGSTITRQREAKAGAPIFAIGGDQGSPMRCGDKEAYRKPDFQALFVVGQKSFEYSLRIGNTSTIVIYFDRDALVRIERSNCDFPWPRRLRHDGFSSIPYQIEQHLLNLHCIRLDRWEIRRELQRHGNLMVAQVCIGDLYHLVNQLVHLYSFLVR